MILDNKAIHNYLFQLEQEDKFSGVVLIARNFRIVFSMAYGYSHWGNKVLNTTNTIFNLGSMGKMFTGVAIVKLAEEGELKFDDRVEKFLPNLLLNEGKITIHQLLTHTSGCDTFFNEKYKKYSNRIRTIDGFLNLVNDSQSLFTPGEKFHYSNTGYLILGAIIEKITGQSFYEYIKKNIFMKANMENTDYYEMDQDVPNLANGYTELNQNMTYEQGLKRNNIFMQGLKGSPAGGCYSTLNDLSKFIYSLENQVLLNREHTILTTAGKVIIGTNKANNSIRYGYGFFNRNINGIIHFGHGGDYPGVHTDLRFYPNEKLLTIVLSNNDIITGKPRVEKYLEEVIFN
ncbi:serine hydrolase domain-containing protein [Bacillus sp. CGMCC 1.16607]|uniref:serine hydrolase domain-containing protein n=1 Tax=Bacillus sp. CGMCC 1.16607 TaxID=3351842 RepID=UPI00362AB046